jgi:hypothetical protein
MGEGEQRVYTDGMEVRGVSLRRVLFDLELAHFLLGGGG